MTGPATPAAVTGGVALLERSLGYTLGSLALVTEDHLPAPTPSPEWDLRALLAHMTESLQALHDAVVVGHLGLDVPATAPPTRERRCPSVTADPVSELRSLGCRLVGAWVGARRCADVAIRDRALAPSVVAAAGAVEVAVHGWDVSRACGQDRAIPPELAGELLELAPLLVSPADRGVRFASPVPVDASAPPGDRLVAFLGRRP